MELRHHVDRLRQELDMAYRSDDRAVSAAHFNLAALHLAEIERASTIQPSSTVQARDDELRQLTRYYR